MVAVNLAHLTGPSGVNPESVVSPQLGRQLVPPNSDIHLPSVGPSAGSHLVPSLSKPRAGGGHRASLMEAVATLGTQLLEGSPKHEAHVLPGDKVHPPRER